MLRMQALATRLRCWAPWQTISRMDTPTIEVTPEWWWRNIHSGSEAVEAARDLLANPSDLLHQDRTLDIMLICSELVFRITGEQLAPARGFSIEGDTMNGPMCTCAVDFPSGVPD